LHGLQLGICRRDIDLCRLQQQLHSIRLRKQPERNLDVPVREYTNSSLVSTFPHTKVTSHSHRDGVVPYPTSSRERSWTESGSGSGGRNEREGKGRSNRDSERECVRQSER
jgi:hypothetical protein